jgi:hypothetical protein
MHLQHHKQGCNTCIRIKKFHLILAKEKIDPVFNKLVLETRRARHVLI